MATTFIAVVLGVLDEAIAVAQAAAGGRRRQRCAPTSRSNGPAPSPTTGWRCRRTRARCGRSRRGDPTRSFAALCAKESVAELAEATLGRLARVIGGGAFSRRSPFAHWYEDVRALGFLRPPWGLAYDNLFAMSFE